MPSYLKLISNNLKIKIDRRIENRKLLHVNILIVEQPTDLHANTRISNIDCHSKFTRVHDCLMCTGIYRLSLVVSTQYITSSPCSNEFNLQQLINGRRTSLVSTSFDLNIDIRSKYRNYTSTYFKL